MSTFARAIHAIPVVASETERDLLYPTPERDQRVQLRTTGEMQRYSGTEWLTDHAGLKGPVHDIRAYGASSTASATINTAAINEAAEAAGIDGLLYFPPGDYDIDGTVTILGACESHGDARLWAEGTAATGTAVQIGDGSALVQGLRIRLPDVAILSKPTGWTGTSVGVLVRKMYNCELDVPFVANFTTGLSFYGESDGCDYNTVRIGFLYNNKVNLKFDSTEDGWTNENVFIGGRLAFDPAEGTAVSGTRQIQILGGTATVDILNNHRFYGLSLEGDVAEYIVESKGLHGYWDRCRWEATSPQVLFDGANAIYNRIHGGYDANRITVTETNGAANNGVESSNGVRLEASPADAVMVLTNGNGSTTPIIMGLAAGQDVHQGAAANLAGYAFALSAQWLRGKQTADAHASPKVEINFNDGSVTLAALRTETTAAATSLGSVTRKLAIYDAAGNILGYLPLYDAIT